MPKLHYLTNDVDYDTIICNLSSDILSFIPVKIRDLI